MKIVLASKSPRRREILQTLRIPFDVMECDVDETISNPSMEPEDIVKSLAFRKAKYAAPKIDSEAYVIGADTIVVLGSKIMGKPKDKENAAQMLRYLSGRWHNVYSGICVMNTCSGEYYTDFENTAVKIRNLSDRDIYRYVESGEPMDKAGSYAIQGIGGLIVEKIDGCYFNVVGLPVFKLSKLMEKFNINLFDLWS